MKLSFTSQEIDKISVELLVLTHYCGDVPFQGNLALLDWRLNGRLAQFVATQKFLGQAREMILIPSEWRLTATQIVILGLGPKAHFAEDHLTEVVDFILDTVYKMRVTSLCLSLSTILANQFDWRNGVRLLSQRLSGVKFLREVILREPVDFIRDAKRRQIQSGPDLQVEYY